MPVRLNLEVKDRMEYYKNYRREYYQKNKEKYNAYYRKKRSELNSCLEGYTVNPLTIPMINYFTPINELTLVIDEIRCKVCNAKLSMSEKLYGNYCQSHTQGQKQNVNNLAKLF